MNLVQSLLPAMEHLYMFGYWLALGAALLETVIGIGWFVPGSTIILLLGALAAKGYFDLGDLLWFAVIGAVIGDNINYQLGKKYGSEFFAKGFLFIKQSHFKKGEEFIKHYGVKSVFWGRFLPSTKEVMPLIAGTFRMKFRLFFFWNILGALGWCLLWVLPGYFFARSVDLAQMWLSRIGFFIVLLLVVFGVFYFLKIFLFKNGKDFLRICKSLNKSFWNNDEVQKFTTRHKSFFVFIRQRLNTKTFWGLPVTLLGVVLVYIVVLLAGIIEDVVTADMIVLADMRISALLAVFRNDVLVKFFWVVTLLGKSEVVLFFTASLAAIFYFLKKRIYILPLFFSVGGGGFLALLGKHVFARPRPILAVYTEHSYSFPSGHAAISVALYGFLMYVLLLNIKKWKIKINIFFGGVLLILLIGFSRLYLGVHYLSDVWGGYLSGALSLLVAISFAQWLAYKEKLPMLSKRNLKEKLAVEIIIIMAFVFYCAFAVFYKIPVADSAVLKDIRVNNLMDIFKSEGLKFTETILGNKQEPLNFIILALNDQEMIDVFAKSGWVLADDVSFHSVINMIKAVVNKISYPNAPVTPYFWNARVHDFAFEKQTGLKNIRVRHHVRFWKTNYITEKGEYVYVGTASFDKGIKWGITHKIAPDIDTERDFLFNDLQETGLIKKTVKQKITDSKLGSNFTGDLFFSDGKAYFILLSK